MSLSPEEKKRIEEEETLRLKVQEKEKGKKVLQGCLVVIILGLLGGLLVGVCVAVLPKSDSSDYFGGLETCREFVRVANAASQGILTDTEIRDKLKPVQSRGSTAEPEIRAASTRLLATLTQGQGPEFSKAIEDLITACKQYGYVK